MSVRERLVATLEFRKADRLCWRCTFGLPRSSSTVQQLGYSYSTTGHDDRYKAYTKVPSSLNKKREKKGSAGGMKRFSVESIKGKRRLLMAGKAIGAPVYFDVKPRNPVRRAPLVCFLDTGSFYFVKGRGKSKELPLKDPWTSNRHYATSASLTPLDGDHMNPSIMGVEAKLNSTFEGGNIREHLRLWQEQHDTVANLPSSTGLVPQSVAHGSQNLITQSGEDESSTIITREVEAEEMEDEDYEDYGSNEPTRDIVKKETFLRRGDLVEIMAGTDVILAIFVRNIFSQAQFYTMRGAWVNRNTGYVRFSVPRFVSPNELKDILPYLPSSGVAEDMIDRLLPMDANAPRGAGANLVKKMSLFHQASDDIFRKYADRLNRTYEIITSRGSGDVRTSMTLGNIAMAVLQKHDPSELTPPMMWAVNRAVTQCQNMSYDLQSNRQNVLYDIRSPRSLANIANVQEWVRDFQEGVIGKATGAFGTNSCERDAKRSENPMFTFVNKARIAVEQSRRTRRLSPNGYLGPSSVKVEPVEPELQVYKRTRLQDLNSKESMIIHYLDAWVLSRYLNPLANFEASGPMILRAVGMYDGFVLDASIGFTFLQELGIISPWENRTVFSLRNPGLPGHGYGFEETTKLQKEAYKENVSTTGFSLPQDSMEGLRRDWEGLPVFCIDSADTLERDDGVSLQNVEGNHSQYWVHVHVANPSAFIAPDSARAKYAAQLSESVYFPERKYSMLLPSMAAEYISLANNRPCLTFSTRMTTEGDILERRIVPGIVNNVHYLTPQTVGRELGISEIDDSDAVSLVTVGEELPTNAELQDEAGKSLAQSHVKILRKLLELGNAARRKRSQRGAIEFYSSALISTIYPQVFLSKAFPTSKVRSREIAIYEGDPIISIRRKTNVGGVVAKMVSDLMILAGETGASWCMERNIPIPYRGIMRNPEPSMSPKLFREQVIDPGTAENGHASQTDLVQYMRLLGQAAISDSPLEHISLGLSAYCKATSPLRRYIDLYTHWQIEAALRQEAKTGTSLIGTNDDSYLPFSRAAVKEYASTAIAREIKLANAKASSTRHWITQALFRAFYFKEAALPETFEVTVDLQMRSHDSIQQGWLSGWNTRVVLTASEAAVREGGIEIGDRWEARISSINPYYKQISMEPTRLIERGIR